MNVVEYLGYVSKNLQVFERVAFCNTDSDLDGKEGQILGNLGGFYAPFTHIVMVDEMYNGQKAILMTEACLNRIDTK